jgi:hypothetical protein
MTKFEKDGRTFGTKKNNYVKQQIHNELGYYYATDLSERNFADFQDVLREDSNVRAAYQDSSWRRDF